MYICYYMYMYILNLGDNTIILNMALTFLFHYDIENLFKLLRYQKIRIKNIYRNLKKKK